ncbi:hypothetical protein [Leptospira noguchii]|nr:hypothetical protein [Leptospira noguchii]
MNELKQNAFLNSMHRSLRVALTQQNAFYESVLGSINWNLRR